MRVAQLREELEALLVGEEPAQRLQRLAQRLAPLLLVAHAQQHQLRPLRRHDAAHHPGAEILQQGWSWRKASDAAAFEADATTIGDWCDMRCW